MKPQFEIKHFYNDKKNDVIMIPFIGRFNLSKSMKPISNLEKKFTRHFANLSLSFYLMFMNSQSAFAAITDKEWLSQSATDFYLRAPKEAPPGFEKFDTMNNIQLD